MPSERDERRTGRADPSARPNRSAQATRISRRGALGAIASVGTLAVAGCQSLSSLTTVDPTWRQEIADASRSSPPVLAGEQLLVGAQDKALHGFRTADGTPEFRVETGGPIDVRPTVPDRGDPYHVHSTDGDVYTVEESGELAWHREGLHEDGVLVRGGSLLVELDTTGGESTAHGFDAATGERRFERPVDTYRTPDVTADRAVVQTPADGNRTRVTALSASDGSVAWQTDAWSLSPAVIADDALVVTLRDSIVTGRSPEDGTVQWRTDSEATDECRLIGLGPQVYLRRESSSGSGEEVVALDRETGDLAWRGTIGYNFEGLVADDAAFVGSVVDDPDGGTLGRVDRFDPDGTHRWKAVTNAPSVESLDLTEDAVVLGSDRSFVVIERDSGETRWRYDPDSAGRLGVATSADSLYVSFIDEGAVAEFPTF